MIRNAAIDGGKAFGWGRVSSEYAQYRDIYPPEFYQKILDLGLCKDGQRILDIGMGTGALPRNLYRYGGKWVGTDISAEQIAWASRLSVGLPVLLVFRPQSRYVQAVPYVKARGKAAGSLYGVAPARRPIAGKSEALVLKYSPSWSGAGETVHPIRIPDCYDSGLERVRHEEYLLNVHFSRELWNGRMKACRGVGASLTDDELRAWESEHLQMLSETAPDELDIRHYATLAELQIRR